MEDGTQRRLSVAQAATELGTTPEAIRGRIKRGTLQAERDGGRVFVILGADQVRPSADQPTDQTALVASLEDQVRFLREELARKDAILLRMAESIPQIEAPREPSGATEARESPITFRTGPEREDTTEASGEAQEATERPWWRRWFQ